MLRASSLAYAFGRYLIAPQSATDRFDLLVLDPGLPDRERPRALEINSAIFPQGEVYRGAQLAELAGVPSALRSFTDVVAEAAFLGSPFTIVIAPHPPTELLSVPYPPLVVDDLVRSISTAGAFVRCNRQPGLTGVTAAYHGLAGGGLAP